VEPRLIAGGADLGALFVDCGVDFSVPTAEKRGKRAFFAVETAESGEIVMGVHVDIHLLTDSFKTARLDHRFGEVLCNQGIGKLKDVRDNIFLGNSGPLFKDGFAELIYKIFSIGIKISVQHKKTPCCYNIFLL
jgi:hypothetical protein